ncbi:hypothetical protein MES4922_190407 [Mesorhizobium ventifaucium]|uniref:Uncharacterized protein n=1 Tax=Mesorhizobium ventifaucium TaxID=666020 RepID=A0ABN8JJC0_9HYPH|nr:hypothetical protein MES4922_190407 [Mesorhizobium ventifaucium]
MKKCFLAARQPLTKLGKRASGKAPPFHAAGSSHLPVANSALVGVGQLQPYFAFSIAFRRIMARRTNAQHPTVQITERCWIINKTVEAH